jgi:hypothetical protein
VDLSPGHLYDFRSLAEVENIKQLKCRVRLYKHEFHRFLGAHILTNTHAMYGVPGVTSFVLSLCFWTYLIHFRSV